MHGVRGCVQVQLVDYGLNSVTEGIEALAVTRVSIRPDGRMGQEAYVTSYQVCAHLFFVVVRES